MGLLKPFFLMTLKDPIGVDWGTFRILRPSRGPFSHGPIHGSETVLYYFPLTRWSVACWRGNGVGGGCRPGCGCCAPVEALLSAACSFWGSSTHISLKKVSTMQRVFPSNLSPLRLKSDEGFASRGEKQQKWDHSALWWSFSHLSPCYYFRREVTWHHNFTPRKFNQGWNFHMLTRVIRCRHRNELCALPGTISHAFFFLISIWATLRNISTCGEKKSQWIIHLIQEDLLWVIELLNDGA